VDKEQVLKTTTQAIENAKKEWELALDCINDAVILLDADDNILRCNAVVTVLTGKSYDDLIDRKWQEVRQMVRLQYCVYEHRCKTEQICSGGDPSGHY